jgi:hypothetical protein
MSQYCTKHTEEELRNIYLQNEYEETYFQNFTDHYDFCFSQLNEDYKDYTDEDWLEEGDSVQERTLNLVLDYIAVFLKSIKNGHGVEWSNLLADYYEEDETTYYHVYHDLKKINPTLAKNEIKILAKSISDDEIFQKHYLYLFEIVANPKNRIEIAKTYSEIYRQAVNEGKSIDYAHQYANLISEGEYHKIYCQEYAFAYDQAKRENKNDYYAEVYADKYSSALVDIKRRYGISDDEEMIKFAIKKVNAYMNSWEYARENKIAEFERFSEIYENIYLNFEFENSESKEVDEKIIMKDVLARFNKL